MISSSLEAFHDLKFYNNIQKRLYGFSLNVFQKFVTFDIRLFRQLSFYTVKFWWD